ncbi:hypothetical protein [Ornithinimicrobium sp. W1665]|uniref:hypothetical protein n=1 Tax=Ornithinimicrobium sp. W1665 TaxID=3416666 RepID=UPI003CEEA905
MTVLLGVLGWSLVLLVVWDAFVTILRIDGPGPLTRGWSEPGWRLLLVVHHRRRIHRVLAAAGPAMTLATIVVWFLGLALGTWLLLRAAPGSVVLATGRVPAGPLDLAYYVPVALTGLGYGDYVPDGPPWTFVTGALTFVATTLLTLAVSYVVSVISAALKRRTTASAVFALGDDPATVARRLAEDPGAWAGPYLAGLAGDVSEVAAQQRAFPVLRYFHSADPHRSPALATLLLADAVLLLRSRPGQGLPEGLAAVVDSAVSELVDVKAGRPVDRDHDAEERDLVAAAGRLDIPTAAGSAFRDRWPTHAEVRDGLVRAVADDGWWSQSPAER